MMHSEVCSTQQENLRHANLSLGLLEKKVVWSSFDFYSSDNQALIHVWIKKE